MAAKRDFYEILGIHRGATKEEINKSYKALALKFHPDRRKDNPKEAEEKFKEVTEAYQVLSDPQKRAAYDQFGHAGVRGAGAQPGAGFEGVGGFGASGFGNDIFGDIFSDLFGGGTRERRGGPARGPDISMRLKISFLDAAFGTKMKFKIPREETCQKCHGDGAEPGYGPTTCPKCQGSGQIAYRQGFFTFSRTCDQCRGEGVFIEKACTQCRGRGTIRSDKSIDITIPPGINTGQKLKLGGKGSAGPRGGKPGNLYFEIEVKPHELFEREGDDIHINVPISFLEASFGGDVEVPTLHGNIKMKIPPGTQSGKRFRIKHKGVPHVEGHGFGDHFVYVTVETPSKLSAKQKKILEEFNKSLDQKNKPLSEAFIKKVSQSAK